MSTSFRGLCTRSRSAKAFVQEFDPLKETMTWVSVWVTYPRVVPRVSPYTGGGHMHRGRRSCRLASVRLEPLRSSLTSMFSPNPSRGMDAVAPSGVVSPSKLAFHPSSPCRSESSLCFGESDSKHRKEEEERSQARGTAHVIQINLIACTGRRSVLNSHHHHRFSRSVELQSRRWHLWVSHSASNAGAMAVSVALPCPPADLLLGLLPGVLST